MRIKFQYILKLLFLVFFHHNLKEMNHLVRKNGFENDRFLKSSLSIRFNWWLWNILVFEFGQSKGYPFTKIHVFLIILIKKHEYPWDLDFWKIHDFNSLFYWESQNSWKSWFGFSFTFQNDLPWTFSFYLEIWTNKSMKYIIPFSQVKWHIFIKVMRKNLEKVVKSTFWMSKFESNLIWFWPQKSEC